MTVTTLKESFGKAIEAITSTEDQIIAALPKMAAAASEPKLMQGSQQHLEETKQQRERLDQIIEECDLDTGNFKCQVTEKMIEGGQKIIDNIEKGPIRDAALIAAAQKIEHFEIASYGTLAAVAKALGHKQAAKLLAETLDEEKATDEKLSKLGENLINKQAAQESKMAA